MDECRRNCKRAARIEEEKERESSSTSSISKKTKLLGLSESEESKSPHELVRGQEARENVADSSYQAAAKVVVIWNSGDDARSSFSSSPSRSSSDDSCEVVKAGFGFVDLKVRSFETEGSTCVRNKFRGDRTPWSEFTDEEEEEEMESRPAKKEEEKAVLREQPPWKVERATPSQEELDEFFGAFESESQRKFSEKYNFDFVKEVPLEGRYEWVRLKQ